MKAKYCALPVLASLACPALAQSVTTLYGSIDAGIDYVSNSKGHSLFQLSSGKRQPDRFGILLREELGAGNAAFARLENGFLSETGAQINPTSFFNRAAYVGLANEQLGAISLGHIADFTYDYVGSLNNAVPGISSFYSPGNLDGLANTRAMDSAIKYQSPDFHGFQFGFMNAFGGKPGDFGAGRQYSVGARYDTADVRVAASYTMSHDRTADIFGTFGLTSLLGQALKPGVQFNASKYSTLAVGGMVRVMTIFKPHATYTRVRLANSQGDAYMNNYQVGVNTDLSGGKGADILGTSFAYSTFEGLTFRQYNLFLTHYLSKRTEIYAGAGLQHASGTNAAQFGYAASSTDTQLVARVGIHHYF